MEAILCHVRDIQTGDKLCLENTLGQSLRDDQQVFIMVFTPNIVPEDTIRRKAVESVASILDQAEENAAARGVSGTDADATVDEAMQQVRRRGP
jgi:hypothetical protein